jgi:putative cell wall-binding protein
MMYFDKIWVKLSQAISVIEEELPRIFSNKEKIPENAIKIFVYETRNEYHEFKEAMKYVEEFDR